MTSDFRTSLPPGSIGQQLFFLSRQGKLAFRRGHDIDGVIAVDTPVDFGLFEVSRSQPNKAVMISGGFLK